MLYVESEKQTAAPMTMNINSIVFPLKMAACITHALNICFIMVALH